MRGVLGAAVLSFVLASSVAFAQEATVTQEEVARAIERGVRYLKSRQAVDGSWPYPTREHVQGAAALAVHALSEAGVPADDIVIQKGIRFIASQPISEVYNAGCVAMALASVDPGRHIRGIAQARDFIMSAQNARGMWSYKQGNPLRTVGDNSNSQFAVLGLHAAMSVGLDVPADVLALAERHYETSQNADGGWGYRPGADSYGSMTAAGVASIYILGARLYVPGEICGQYRQDLRIAAGLSWLARNYTVTTNPAGSPNWRYYYLYALERVGVLTGLRAIGPRDWYLDGARYIVDTQSADGSWLPGRDQVPNTCFALLFLSKGNVPVLINKLAHAGEWNVDMHDAQNLSAYVSRLFGQRLGWQTVTTRDSLETLLSAPILYVTGHSWPDFTPEEIAKFKAFFAGGGFMFAEACCGRKEFDSGFRGFIRRIFGDLRLGGLDRTHGVYRSWFKLTTSPRTLEGLQAGCRTPVIYSSKDLSCTWEKNLYRTQEEAFQFGANIAAYATGKERLRPKLEQRHSPGRAKLVSATPGAFTFAQAMYSGMWDPHPGSGPKLLSFLNEKAGLDVAAEPVTIPLTDPNLSNYPFIYMTGMEHFVLGEAEKKALAEYLARGGFLFADASAGREAFDSSFREMVRAVLPDSPLEAMPPDSPVYDMAFDIRKVTYTAAVREADPNLDTLTLYGAKIDGRTALVYSPYDIGCALAGFPAYGSRGLVSEDAFKAATNIVLYALTY